MTVALSLVLQHIRQWWWLYVVAHVVWGYIFTAFLSPLAKFPGPILARCSRLWQLRVTLSKEQNKVYQRMHQKYGPVFRDGPNSLSFCDAEAMKQIYGSGSTSFPKPKGFLNAGATDNPSVFFALTADLHRKARRRVGGAYSMNSILLMEPQIDQVVTLLIERLTEYARTNEATDFTRWINYMTFDVISELAYGAAFGFLETRSDVRGIMAMLQGGFEFFTIMNFIPILPKVLFSPTLLKLLPPPKSGFPILIKTAEDTVEERIANPSQKRDLLNLMLESKDSDGNAINVEQVKGEVIGTLTAGADTTAATIQGTFGLLLTHPEILKKLLTEIDTAYANEKLTYPIPLYTECTQLPYLQAIIHESLRLSQAIGIIFEREVPSGGAEISPGVWVPGGTRVGVNNWVMGRNQELYGPTAEDFVPERWLDEKTKSELMKYEFGFGHGSRICIGKNVAIVEINKTIVTLLHMFEFSPAGSRYTWREEDKLFIYKFDMDVRLKLRSRT